MRKRKGNRWIAGLLLAVMLVTAVGTDSVTAAELRAREAEAVQKEQRTAETEAETKEAAGKENATVSGAVPAKEAAVKAASLTAEPETKEGVEYVLGRPMTEDEKEKQLQLIEGYASMLKPLEPDKTVERVSDDNENMAKSAVLPSSYDSREKGIITSVKNQNPYGTCWAFSSLNMAEASLVKKGILSNPDLSEFHLVYYTNRSVTDPLEGTAGDSNYKSSINNILTDGGNYNRSSNTLMAWMGAVDESSVPYSMIPAALPATVDAAYGQNVALLKSTCEINLNDSSMVKQAIVDYGAVGIMYYAPTSSSEIASYYNINTAAQYCDVNLGVNHAVSVVGWNDDYSANNFLTKPSENGAWLVKNSWGTGYGDNGYFWLSYEDATINDTVFAFDMTSLGAYDNNYQYDGAGGDWYISYGSSMVVANVFTAHAQPGKKEILKAVAFALDSADTNYSIQIYKNPTDAEDPESGTSMLNTPQTGNITFEGYHTVDLSQPVELSYGETFAVVITISKSGSSVWIGCEADTTGAFLSTASAESGQSLFKPAGGVWQDYGSRYNQNFRIKAYTVNSGMPGETVSVTGISMPETEGNLSAGETKKIEARVVPSNATNQKINWASSDTAVAAVDGNGWVTAKKPGTAIITATTAEGGFSSSYRLEVKDASAYTDIQIRGVTSITYIGSSYQFSAVIKPDTAPDKTVTWTTSDKNVAEVDANGLVTAMGIGTATITATANGDSRLQTGLTVTVPDNNHNRVRSFVNRMYTVALNRPADNNGATYWTNELLAGYKDGAAVAKGFILSKEMERRNLSDNQFVDMLYKTFFDRNADANGKAYWMNLLQNGVSRAYVFKGFCHSKEFTNICNSYGITRGTIKLTENRDQNHNITMYVYRCYERTLGRKPDVSGLNFWSGQILTKKRTPIDVAGNFVFSQEFKNKNLSDEEYVKVLYRMFFDREYNAPGTDPNGIKFWLNELKTGRRDRYKVFMGFANSQEFKSVLKTFGL